MSRLSRTAPSCSPLPGHGSKAPTARPRGSWFHRACILSLALLCTQPARAQGSGPAADTARAREILASALQTLGGSDRIARVGTWDLEGVGSENLSAEAQGETADRPTWRTHEERVVIDARTMTAAWQRRTPRNDNSIRWRRMIYGPDRTDFVDLNSGAGVLRPTAAPPARVRGLARRVPHLLLLEAATTPRTRWGGERTIDGMPYDMIHAVMTDSARLTLYIARAPVVLHRVEYQAHLPGRGDVTVAWSWRDWIRDAAVGMRPRSHHVEIEGVQFQLVEYTRFATDGDIAVLLTAADTSHVSGAMGGEAPAASALPATGEVAPGVHVGNISGFVVMAVVFDTFVVAVETPEAHPGFEVIPAARPSASVAAAHLRWLRGIAREKPITFAVISHHHSDHLGGAQAAAAAGVTLLVSRGDVGVTRRSLSAPRAMAADGSRERHDAARVAGVDGRLVIADSSRTIEVLQVGPNPHTAENLIVWLPRERILFQGDLFYYAEGDPFPPPGREVMNRFFARWIRERGIQPLAIYGVHNDGAAGPDAVSRALRQ